MIYINNTYLNNIYTVSRCIKKISNNMLFLLFSSTIMTSSLAFTFPDDNLYYNTLIQNTCLFHTIRIPRRNVDCIDYGVNVYYCDHFVLPNEFYITNESGINFEEDIRITPRAIWAETNFKRDKIANLYYRFSCNYLTNYEPKLVLNIVPLVSYDKTLLDEMAEISDILFLIILVYAIYIYLCYWFGALQWVNQLVPAYIPGIIPGYIIGSHINRRLVCA